MKQLLIYIGIVFLTLAAVEIIGLLWLKSTVSTYAKYWDKKAYDDGEIVYIAMGDSAAQGIGAASPQGSYVNQVAEKLESSTGKSVRIINLSVTGATVQDVIENQIPQLDSLPEPDLATIEIGANDTANFDPQKFQEDFMSLASMLPEGTYVSDLPDFGRGPRLAAQREGATIARKIINKSDDLRLVPLEEHTQKHFNHWLHYSFDFFHPNSHGYGVWADAFWKEIEGDI